jgi:hypothetical protein
VLPPLNDDGLLPQGVHNATWDELQGRFGGSAQRERVLDGLLRGCQGLHAAGVKVIWLGGSLVTSKPEPRDFDAVWDPSGTGIDLSKIDAVLLDEDDQRNGRLKQKIKYGGEFLVGIEGQTGKAFQAFLQEDRQGRPKGIVRLDLRTLP